MPTSELLVLGDQAQQSVLEILLHVDQLFNEGGVVVEVEKSLGGYF